MKSLKLLKNIYKINICEQHGYQLKMSSSDMIGLSIGLSKLAQSIEY